MDLCVVQLAKGKGSRKKVELTKRVHGRTLFTYTMRPIFSIRRSSAIAKCVSIIHEREACGSVDGQALSGCPMRSSAHGHTEPKNQLSLSAEGSPDLYDFCRDTSNEQWSTYESVNYRLSGSCPSATCPFHRPGWLLPQR